MSNYVVKDQKLIPLVKDMADEELYLNMPEDVRYKYLEELDGQPLNEKEARELFPEEFI